MLLLPTLPIQSHKLPRKPLQARKLPAALPQNPPDIIPPTLVHRRPTNLLFRKRDLPVHNRPRQFLIPLQRPRVLGGMSRVGKDDEEAMRPRGVVPHVLLQQGLDGTELAVLPSAFALRREEAQLPHQVLPIRPDVIVLAVLLKHLRHEVSFRARQLQDLRAVVRDRRVQVIDDQLPMVPDLVVLLVRERHAVHPG